MRRNFTLWLWLINWFYFWIGTYKKEFDETFKGKESGKVNKGINRTKKLSNVAEIIKSGAEGVVLGEIINMSPKQAIDEKAHSGQ